jgi:hypothetical protein
VIGSGARGTLVFEDKTTSWLPVSCWRLWEVWAFISRLLRFYQKQNLIFGFHS